MKASTPFENAISTHLKSVADKDPLFAETLKKPNKNIKDCITYILNQVKNSGCNAFVPEEIYRMAVHFYDEDDLKSGAEITNCKIVVPEKGTISHTEKTISKITAKKSIKSLVPNQPSLF